MLRIIFTSILIIFAASAVVQGQETDELEDMTAFVDSQNLSIQNWQVVMKEKMDQSTIKDIIDELKNSYKVTRIEDENVIKYQIRDAHKEYDFSVIYNVVLPKVEITYPELSVVIKGEEWDSSIHSDYQQIKKSISETYFTKSKRVFSWLSTEASGIIVEGEFEQELTNYFNIQNKTTQLDNISNSERKYIYGYTSQWNEKITIENAPINVQVPITNNEKGIPEMTLGTPILIHEY